VTPPQKLPGHLVEAAVDLLARSGGYGIIPVEGDSMRPTLPPGSALWVRFAREGLRFGDLVVFRQSGVLVIHRLLGSARFPRGRRGLRTRGDALCKFDPEVHGDRVLGRVVAFRRDDRWRSASTRPARAYARIVALHGLFWSVVGVIVERGPDLWLRGAGVRISFRQEVASADRWLLRLLDRLLFERVHREVPDPTEASSERAPGPPPPP
jgi:hypothetical protein